MKSMTGYAFARKQSKTRSVEVIMRSYNFKYLEVSVRNLPQDKILLEEKVKREIKQKILRGKIEVFIFLKGHPEGDVYINEDILAKYINRIKHISKKYNLKGDLQLRDLLNLPHVTVWEEEKREKDIIIPAVKEAVDKLIEFKEKEGVIIKKEMLDNLKKLKYNAQVIQKSKPKANDSGSEKTDIDEEVSLMTFYIDKLEKSIKAANMEHKGKSLDFLTQEILRELNTASSKTTNASLGALIVESKNYLERIREQAQNIE